MVPKQVVITEDDMGNVPNGNAEVEGAASNLRSLDDRELRMLEIDFCKFTWNKITNGGSVSIPLELHKEILKCIRISFQYMLRISKKRLARLEKELESMSDKKNKCHDHKVAILENVEAQCPKCRSEPFKNYFYFGVAGEMTMLQFMRRFGKFDGTAIDPELDPFEGKVVFIDTTRFLVSTEKIMELVTSFLKTYGMHISSLNLTLPKKGNMATEVNNWLVECLSMLPNLKHLKVNEDDGSTVCDCQKQLDLEFGEHLEVCQAEIVGLLREKFDMSVEEYCEYIEATKADKNERFGMKSEGYYTITTLRPDPVPQLEQPVEVETLKLCGLSALNFNTLVRKYGKSVSWLHIEPSSKNCVEYVDWGALEFPNLKSFYVKLSSQKEAQKLWSLHASWGSVPKVHLDYDWKAEFMGWGDILKIVQEKWGENLIDLKIRLPKATSEEEKRRVREDAAKCGVILPKLKTLKIWISDRDQEDVPVDFLKAVKEQVGNEFEISSNNCFH